MSKPGPDAPLMAATLPHEYALTCGLSFFIEKCARLLKVKTSIREENIRGEEMAEKMNQHTTAQTLSGVLIETAIEDYIAVRNAVEKLRATHQGIPMLIVVYGNITAMTGELRRLASKKIHLVPSYQLARLFEYWEAAKQLTETTTRVS